MVSSTRSFTSRACRAALWLVGSVAVLAFVLRTFVFDIYQVDRHSMEPSLHGDPSERVLVRYTSQWKPERFDAVVLLREGRTEAEVKRVVGLGGESVHVRDGDLFINGSLLPWGTPRPQLVTVYDAGMHKFADSFSGVLGEKKIVGDLWSFAPDARTLQEPIGFEYRLPLTDDYVKADGQIVRGVERVNDAALEFDLRLVDGRGWIQVHLTEKGDRFDFELETLSDDQASVRVWRSRALRQKDDERKFLDKHPVAFALDEWRHVRVANIDNSLTWLIDGTEVLRHTYEQNEAVSAPDPNLIHVAPRIRLRAKNLAFELRGLRVLRDLYYTRLGREGTAAPVELGPNEVFVLGDNSAVSQDSREWGPVPLSAIVGRPEWVIWPWAQRRHLDWADDPR